MKRLVLLAPLLFVFGCPDEDNDPTPDAAQPVADAARPDTFVPDAAVDDARVEDAAQEDARIEDARVEDAAPPDGNTEDATVTGEIVVRVVSRGVGVEAAPVIFHDPAGEVSSDTLSDGQGEARATIVSNSAVTVLTELISKGPYGWQAQTVFSVQPGDTITVQVEQGSFESEVGNVLVTLPGAFAGANSYEIDFGCGNYYVIDPAQSHFYSVTDNCVGTSTVVGLIATARDIGYVPIAFALVDEVPVAFGVDVTVPGPWRTDFETLSISLDNAPAPFIDAGVGSNLVRRSLDLYPVGFVDYFDASRELDATIIYPPYGDARDLRMAFGGGGQFAGYGTRVPRDTTFTLDLTNDLMPLADTPTVTASPTTGRPVLSWNWPQPVPSDATLAFLQVFTNQEVLWYMVAPPGATALPLPALPAPYDELIPAPGSEYDSLLTIHVESTLVADYDEFRRLPAITGFTVFTNEMLPGPAPIGTRVRYTGCETTAD